MKKESYVGEVLTSKFDSVPMLDVHRESLGSLSFGDAVLVLREPDNWGYLQVLSPRGVVAWVFESNMKRINEQD